MFRIITALALLATLAAVGTARAATLQQVGVFEQPMYVTSDPANPDRLFVVERAGKIREVSAGSVSTFADLGPRVGCCAGERGLLSIALAPDFATSGRLYAAYNGSEGEIHISELLASGGFAPLSSLRDVLVIPHSDNTNHNGGQLQFGPEGLLYVSTGDGGGSDDELGNAQSHGSLLGKILRIDPRQAGLLPYSVPAGNPFLGLKEPYDTIWASGLRNPYRFSFDRLTGALTIADVGQGQREEVDYLAPGAGAGANFGWNCFEGLLPSTATDPECATPPPGGYTFPIFEYPHDAPSVPGGATGCAIIGGYVARDANLDGLYGRYLYSDFCRGDLRSFDPSNPAGTDRSEGLSVDQVTSFGEDSCGRLYVASSTGKVWRLDGSTPSCVAIVKPPAAFSYIGVTAQGRRIKRGKRAQITAWVSPCAGRKGEPVKLWRGRKHVGTRHLNRACSVRFRPRITRRSNFRAWIAADANYVAATSRKLKIKIKRRNHHRRGSGAS